MASKNHDFAINNQETAVPEDRTDTIPLLATKLYRPPVTPDLEKRTRLIDHLERNRQRPLTLISAPAGYGKTVLVSQWLESCNCPSAWLSVDESDNNLGVFVSYLLAAVSGTFPDLGSRTLNLLSTPNLPPVPMLAQTLTNDLDQINKPFILVMDDIHRVHLREIYDLFDFLLQHPPHNLHLVMIGRHDPPLRISSMRARGQVTEVRALDLCFSSDETSRLMRKMLDREVDPAIAADWTNATEGWVTALRLAVLSLRHRGRDDDLGLRVQGDSRYLREYLLSEVLAHLPNHYQDYLLKIAILERFCGSLCEAVCQMDPTSELNGPAGETFIDWLVCENLFLIALDNQHKWFRFHHLFQEMLVEMLHSYTSSGEIAELRMRASRWFAENGWVEEAIKHALAAGKTEYAVGLVVNHRQQLMNNENWIQLQQWLDLLTEEIIVNDPVLAITKSQVYSSYGRDREFRSQVARQLADMPVDSPFANEVRGELAAGFAIEGILTGQGAKAIAKSHEALAILPPQAHYHRNFAIGVQSIGYQMLGDLNQGTRILAETLSHPGLPLKSRSRLLIYQAWLYFMEGDLATALRFAGESIRFAVKNKLLNAIYEAQYISGIAYYLRNELALAEQRLWAIVEDPVFSDPVQLTMATCALARMYQAQHHPEKATELLQRIIAHLEKIDNTFSLEIIHAFQVELSLDQGDPALARSLSLSVNYDGYHPFWYHYMIQLTPIKLMLIEGNTSGLTHSLNTLVQIREELRSMNRKVLLIEVLALLALVHHAMGDVSATFENLTEALRLGEPGGFIRSFVDLGAPMANLLQRSQEQQAGGQHADYIAKILAAFPKTQPPQARAPLSQFGEALTGREFEVLTLLAQRLSNKEIVEQLSISLNTVKSHTSNIYSKFGVNNRKQAVKKAVELDLLSKD